MKDRFNWWLPFYSAVVALILFVLVIIYGGDADLLYALFAFPASIIFLTAALVLSICKLKLRSLAVLSMVVVFWVFSCALLKNSRELHSTVQWHLRSKDYKAKVLAQPVTANGELKHIELDFWGFPGADTVMYLVLDPTDSLWMAAKSRSPGKFNGIPCEVYRVRRLESHYYTVLFYTNTNWDRCD
jgi:hypothetical protein